MSSNITQEEITPLLSKSSKTTPLLASSHDAESHGNRSNKNLTLNLKNKRRLSVRGTKLIPKNIVGRTYDRSDSSDNQTFQTSISGPHQYVPVSLSVSLPHQNIKHHGVPKSKIRKRIEKASLIVADAVDGIYRFKLSKAEVRWASMTVNLARGRYFVVVALLTLSLLEQPAWCFNRPDICTRSQYLSVNNHLLNVYVSLGLEAAILIYFFFKSSITLIASSKVLTLKAMSSLSSHTREAYPVLVLLASLASLADVTLTLNTPTRTFRLSPLLRFILLANVLPQVAKNLRVLCLVLSSFGRVVLIAGLYIVFFGWMGWVLFVDIDRHQGGYMEFSSLGQSIGSMEVLLTTANWPDVMMPAYDNSRWAFVFFGIFIVLGVWFIMPVALAVVVQAHSDYQGRLHERSEQNRVKSLHAAFSLLDLNNDGMLQFGTVISVFHELNQHYSNIEFIHHHKASQLLLALEEGRTKAVSRENFLHLCTILQADEDYIGLNQPLWSLNLPEPLIAMVDSYLWHKVVDTVIVSSFIALVVDSSYMIITEEKHLFSLFQTLDLAILIIYTLEVGLMTLVHGHSYANKLSSRMLYGILGLGWLLKLVLIPLAFSKADVLRIILLLRGFAWLVRVIPSLRFMTGVYGAVLPEFLSMASTLIVLFFLFGLLGVQLFGGLIRTDSKALAQIDFGELGYYANSMNYFGSAGVTLFELMVLNNWQVIEEGYAIVGGPVLARLYVVSFYILAVVLVLNLTVAVILDVFLKTYLDTRDQRQHHSHNSHTPNTSHSHSHTNGPSSFFSLSNPAQGDGIGEMKHSHPHPHLLSDSKDDKMQHTYNSKNRNNSNNKSSHLKHSQDFNHPSITRIANDCSNFSKPELDRLLSYRNLDLTEDDTDTSSSSSESGCDIK